MSSYINQKDYVFKHRPVKRPLGKRCEGRMKRYDSCTDNRAWALDDEDRGKHLIDLVTYPRCGHVSSSGQYVPLPVLLSILQAIQEGQLAELKKKLAQCEKGGGSDAEINALKKQILENEAIIADLRKQLANKDKEMSEMDAAMRAAKQQVDNISGRVNENTDLRTKLDAALARIQQLERELAELRAMDCEAVIRERDALLKKLADAKAERDALVMRLKDYEGGDEELERLRYRAKEADVMRMERDALKEQLDALEAANAKLCQDLADFEAMAKELEMYKMKMGEIGDCDDLKREVERLMGVEQERDFLLRQLMELECAVADQEDEINRQLTIMEKIVAGGAGKEEQLVKSMSSARLELEEKNDRIKQLENLLKDQGGSNALQEELDKECQKTKDLRDELSEYMAKIAALQSENDLLKVQVEALRNASGGNTDLQDLLIKEREARENAEKTLRKTLDDLETLEAEKARIMDEAEKYRLMEAAGKAQIMDEKPTSSIEKECKDLLEHSQQKYEDEKKARDMIEGVLEVTQAELDKEKEARRKLEEQIKALEQSLAENSDMGRKQSLNLSNELKQLQDQLAEANKKAANDVAAAQKDIQDQMNAKIDELTNRINELMAENEGLKSGIKGTFDNTHSLEKQIADLLGENAELKKQLGENKTGDDIIQALENQVKDLLAENAKLKLETKQTTGEIDMLQKQVQDLLAENAKLNLGGKQTEEDIQALEKKLEDLLAENAKLNMGGKQTDEENRDLEKKLEDLLAENAKLNQGTKETDGKIGALENQIQDLLAEIAKLKLAAKDTDGATEVMENRIKDMLSENAKLQLEAKETDGTVKELEKQIKDLLAENAKLQLGIKEAGRVEVLEKQIKDLLAENAKLQLGIKEAGRVEVLEKQIKDLLAENAKLELKAKETDGAVGALEKQLKDILEENAKLKQAAKETSDEIKSLGMKVNDLQKENSQLESLSKEHEKALKNTLNELKAENESLKLKADQLTKEDKELDERAKAEKAQMDDIIRQLEDQIKALNQKIAQSESDANKSKAAENDTKKLVESEQQRAQTLQDRIKKLEADASELADLKTKCASLEAEIEKLKKDKKDFSNMDNQMKTMQEECDKRIADLMAANAKEKEESSKKYNQNLAELKATYERDMKAMSDRHNDSIAQLQGLHEDEVKALNADYSAKLKEANDKQGKPEGPVERKLDVKPVDEEEQRKLLEKKHQEEIDKMKKDHEDSLNKIKKKHQDDKNELIKKFENEINKLEESNKEELKRLKDINQKTMEALKAKHRDMMNEEKGKVPQDSEALKSKRPSPSDLVMSRTEIYDVPPDGPCKDGAVANLDVRVSPSLTCILRKALQCGLESLTFEELSYVHARICSETGKMILAKPGLKMAPMTPALRSVDQKQLCSRIACLEKELSRRDQLMQQKLCSMECALRCEQKRVCDVKQKLTQSLTVQQQHNENLRSELGNMRQQHCELESERDVLRKQAEYHEQKATHTIQHLEKAKSMNRVMENELLKEKNNVKHLQSLLEAETSRGKTSNQKESDLIESLRIKLETSLDNEAKMRFQLEKMEAYCRSTQEPTRQSPPRPCTSHCPAPCNTEPTRESRTCSPSCPAPCNTSLRDSRQYALNDADELELRKAKFLQDSGTRYVQKKPKRNY